MVTFRRPEALKDTLARIAVQTKTPDTLIVVDNGSDPGARESAQTAGAQYVDAGGNLGPAGGIALGMEHVMSAAADDDWLVVFDDDDPPNRDDLLDELWRFAAECSARDAATAGVGGVGALYDRRVGIFRRVGDEELTGAVTVDYIGGGQFPMFSCRAIRACGVFDRGYFFGFDDAEYGLRLRKHGYALYAHGGLWHEQRAAHERLNLAPSALRTSDQTSAWRRYYNVRNLTSIAKRYGSPLAIAMAAGAGGLRGSVSLGRARRPLSEVILPLRGALDGLVGRSGRRVSPQGGEKTHDV